MIFLLLNNFNQEYINQAINLMPLRSFHFFGPIIHKLAIMIDFEAQFNIFLVAKVFIMDHYDCSI